MEGGDQIGKGEVTEYLLKKLQKERIPVCKLSFPMYSTPFGYLVRKTLEEGFFDIPQLKEIIGTRRELEVKISLFVINRLEVLESILRRFGNSKAYFLLDRSPYSQAVTIAYGLGGLKSIKEGEVGELIKLGFKLENLFLKTLGLSECVLHLKADYGKKGWVKARSDNDLYEIKSVQDKVDSIYERMGEIVGDGWYRIYTKRNGEFRNRQDIQKEVDVVVDSLNFKSVANSKSEIFDVLQVAEYIYGVDLKDLQAYKKYFRNIELDDNEKNKETYSLAYEIGKYIVKKSKRVCFKDINVKKNIKLFLRLYPEVLFLLEYYFGIEFLEEFRRGLDE